MKLVVSICLAIEDNTHENNLTLKILEHDKFRISHLAKQMRYDFLWL